MPVEAKGAPLSVRIASGRPTSRKSRRNAGLAPSVLTEGSPLQSSRLRLKWSVTVSGKQYLPSRVLNYPLKSAGQT